MSTLLQIKKNVKNRWQHRIRNDIDRLDAYNIAWKNAILAIRLDPWYIYMIEQIEQLADSAMSKTSAVGTSLEEIRYRQGVLLTAESLLDKFTDVSTPSE